MRLRTGYGKVTDRLRGGCGQVEARLRAGYGHVTAKLRAGYGQVTGRSRTRCGEVTEQTRQMLPKSLTNVPTNETCPVFFNANPKMQKRVWTAQVRADRGSGNPQNC